MGRPSRARGGGGRPTGDARQGGRGNRFSATLVNPNSESDKSDQDVAGLAGSNGSMIAYWIRWIHGSTPMHADPLLVWFIRFKVGVYQCSTDSIGEILLDPEQ